MDKNGSIWDLRNFQSITLEARKKKGKETEKKEKGAGDSSLTDNDSN